MDKKKIQEIIDDVEVVSFDVFDTIILRNLWEPHDVFTLVGRKLMPPFDFREVRIRAEALARAKTKNADPFSDVSLDGIYGHFPDVVKGEISNDLVERLKKEEIGVEKAVCVRNPFLYGLYRYAMKRRKRVVFCSDMYLPIRVVKEITARAGFDGVEKIYLSVQQSATKISGRLYDRMIEDLEVKPSKILHIGDNKSADVWRARQKGMRTFYYKKSREAALDDGDFRLLHDQFTFEERKAPEVSAWLALVANRFYAARPGSKTEVFTFFGFSYAAPLVLAFVDWVAQGARKLKAEKVFFLARDGYTLQRVYQKIFAGKEGYPPSAYLYASRRAFRIPAITRLDRQSLGLLSEKYVDEPLENYFARIGLGAARYRKAVRKRGFENWRQMVREKDLDSLRRLFRDVQKDILSKSGQERRVLKRFFRLQGIFQYKTIAFVDIGWNGTLQKSYEKLLRFWGKRQKVSGYYLGLLERKAVKTKVNDLRNMKGYLSHFGQPASGLKFIKDATSILEFMLYAPHGSVLGFVRKGWKVGPVLDRHVIPYNQRHSMDIRSGITEFVSQYKELLGAGMGVAEIGEILKPFRRLVYDPTPAEARALGGYLHSAQFGGYFHLEPLAVVPRGKFFAAWPFSIWKGYRRSTWKTGYLKQLPLARMVPGYCYDWLRSFTGRRR